MKFKNVYAVFLFIFSIGYGQLPNFTLQHSTTDETCSGNGSITLVPAGLTAGALLEYHLYKLPVLDTPIEEFTSNTYNNLFAGDYRLIATQVLGIQSSVPVQFDFTISHADVPILFEVTDTGVSGSCDQTGSITVVVTSVIQPAFFQIVSGPLTVPPQTSNVFNNLPAGEYVVRVIDGCGEAEVKTWTIHTNSTILTIAATSNPSVATSCTTIDVINNVTPSGGANIIYPLHVEYVVHFPSGDQTIIQDYPTGPTDVLPLTLTLPLFLNDPYSYDLKITDSCGHNVILPDNQVDPTPLVTISDVPNECGDKFLNVSVSNYMPPYTITFTDKPTDFDPVNYLANYADPQTNPVLTFGSATNTVPYGNYEVSMIDACGRTAIGVLNLIKIPLEPTITETSPNCVSPNGKITISIPENRKVVFVEIIDAPAAYVLTHPLPSNVSPVTVQPGAYTVNNLPVGNYLLKIIDSCGDLYSNVPAEIKPFSTLPDLSISPRASCTAGLGSMRIRSLNGGGLITLTVLSGPVAFSSTYPVNLTPQIDNGIYFNGAMAAGDYTFEGTDACGANLTGIKTLVGYDPGSNNFSIDRNCGTFNIDLADNSNITGSYWLQKKNPTTGNYEHPDTGVVYVEGTPADTSNALPLTNNTINFNIANVGTFRILKVYQAFDSQGTTTCYEAYPDFTFSGALDILGSYSLNCAGGAGPESIFIDVLGVPPYNYRIIQKDGVDFSFDNGTNDTFQNLDPAIYKFEVEDSCGRLANTIINVATLQPLVTAIDPAANNGTGEILFCSNNGETTSAFDLTTFNQRILGNQPVAEYTITYYLTPEDADAGVNEITTDVTQYNNRTNPQTIYVRVVQNVISRCYATTSFNLVVGTSPILTAPSDIYLCEGTEERLSADFGYDAYEWSTGDTTRYIDVDQPGTYTVTVKNIYGTSECSASQTFTVMNTESAHFDSVDINDWTEFDNSFTMHVSGDGDYVYSIDGGNFQPDPTFTGLEPGLYTVTINDLHGCPGITKDVLILNYPKFFTPNGDGYNEKWKIRNSIYEPGMKTFIFDRYGKLITGFEYDAEGWDGNYNGNQLPSDDYWFVVERVDGKVHRGHFAMKR
ncbi:MAG: hypothetical protein CFE23_15360 [Flavobacterium sp. BFFFF1]|uniref:T9SS type B sorting domain-containing protein n=1 Tax=Flavobacterium sp. BFFFF1 TaxID=2015557 RepID=UPI000BC951FB|nr:T9SS type B sorting domain-containing protein [Flavobacterium sp. BFFFF1]OYU79172.1 MAG: hypothetical protein CFE23_15360 [Flavobacterium sp. BFFFF1]